MCPIEPLGSDGNELDSDSDSDSDSKRERERKRKQARKRKRERERIINPDESKVGERKKSDAYDPSALGRCQRSCMHTRFY